ncbi:MAG: hypothetical protein E7011_04110 [Alphaproteobacteria bacterium]|nr:hypothetical protein [Alphaproteobacteria bacterium]
MPTLHQSHVTHQIKQRGAKPDLRTAPSKSTVNADIKKMLADAEQRLKTETDPAKVAKLNQIISNLSAHIKG